MLAGMKPFIFKNSVERQEIDENKNYYGYSLGSARARLYSRLLTIFFGQLVTLKKIKIVVSFWNIAKTEKKVIKVHSYYINVCLQVKSNTHIPSNQLINRYFNNR